MKYFLLLSILVFVLFSCTKDLPFPDVESIDLMVINGLLSPEGGAKVHVSQSCHVTDPMCEGNSINNAKVFLQDANGNTLVELQHQSYGLYTSEGFEIKQDESYSIEAESAALQKIKANAHIPKTNACNLISNDEKIYEDYLCRTFKIEIEDDPNELNYYLIHGWTEILNGDHEEDFLYEVNSYLLPHTGFLTKDINAENKEMVSRVNIYSYPLPFIFLTDENFNGQTYPLEFGMHELDISLRQNLKTRAHINVKSVSKELYDYYKSVTLYQLTAGAGIAEPQPIFSNIENGIGILGAYTEKQFAIDLPDTEFWIGNDFKIENNGCSGPCEVKFFGDFGDNVSFIWDFGDGNTSTEKNPVHEYKTAGEYQVNLEVAIGDERYGNSQTVQIR